MPTVLDLAVLAGATTKPRVDAFEGSTLHLRVMPWDLHFTRMEHGRFHVVMDAARIDLIVRTGLLPTVVRRGWAPLTAVMHFEAWRSLKLWDRYAVTTRVACWDEKWTWLEHRVEKDGQPVAIGYARTLFRGRDGNVPTRTLLEAVGAADMTSPPLPDALVRLCRASPVMA